MKPTVDVDLGIAATDCTLLCPLSGRAATCRLVEDTEAQQWIAVERCSRFTPEDDVRCDLRCVELLNLGITLDTDGDG